MTAVEDVKRAMDGRWLAFYEEHIVGRLKPTSDGWYSCRCPFSSHGSEDRHPSFSVNGEHGGFECFAESIKGDGFDFVQRMNLAHDFIGAVEYFARYAGVQESPITEVKKPSKPKQKMITYDYTDAEGNLLYQVVRFHPKDFRQRQPDGKGGWKWSLKGVTQVLYRLPEVLAAVKAGQPVYVVEGEKDADNLRRRGLTATTNPMGAGKWQDSYTQTLTGAHVVILHDNDKAGQDHVEKVRKGLKRKAKSLKVIDLPDLPEKGDVSDWLAAGHTVEELQQLVEKTPDWHQQELKERLPQTMTVTDILRMQLPEPVWVVPGMIPAGLTLLAGKPKLGKSWLSLSIALGLAHGGRVLGKIPVDQLGCLYLALEDTPRRLQDRIRQMEAGPTTNLHICCDWRRGQEGTDDIDLWLEANPDTRLVIIDTLQRFRSPNGRGRTNVYAEDYEVMTALKKVADRHDAAIMVVHHVRKGVSDDPLELVSGSFGLSGAADTIAVLNRGRGEADGTLYITGRDVEEQNLALERDARVGWTLLGDAAEWTQTKERREVLEVIKEAAEPISPKEIADTLGKEGSAIRFLLTKLLEEGLVTKAGYGKYTLPPTTTTNTTNTTNSTNSASSANSSIYGPKQTQSVSASGEVLVMDQHRKTPPEGLFSGSVSGVSTVSEVAVAREAEL